LPKFVSPIRFHINPTIGKGDQYFPWIHINDLCMIYLKAIENPRMNGSYNAVAAEYLTQKEFILSIKKALKKIIIIPRAPVLLLKLILGERLEMLLKGSRVSNKKILETGFKFKYGKVNEALKELTEYSL
jgi:uncharacterized protein